MLKSIKSFCLKLLLSSGFSADEALRIVDDVEKGWYHPSKGDWSVD